MDNDVSNLKLQFLSQVSRYDYLNTIAVDYAHKNRESLAFMCLAESLRLNPVQSDILVLAESLREHAVPRFPNKLRDDKLLVSVLMPTFNRTDEIHESIRSVLKQSFQDFELIIINDGGTDTVKGIIDSFESPKIKYIKLPVNKGLSSALNEGVLAAEGKYIAYLDDDDIYYPDHLRILVNCIEHSSGYDCVYANSWRCYGEIRNNEFVEQSRELYEIRPRKFDSGLLSRENYISTLNILHKKNCFMKAGLFNADLTCLMDWDLWVRFVVDFKFHQIDAITGEYRWKRNNMTLVNSLEQRFVASILKPYHEFGRGNIGLLKSCICNNKRENAEKLFGEIIRGYHNKPKSPAFIEEVFCAQNRLGVKSRKFFLMKLSHDYFKLNPRKCLNSIFKNRHFIMFLGIVPAFPTVFLRSMIRRISKTLQ